MCGKGTDEKLKEAFEAFDLNGDGRLSFDEFLQLLQKGDPEFPEEEAHELFHEADRDGGGFLDFKEFVDYIYGNKDFGDFVHTQQEQSAEDEAKRIVLGKSLRLRTESTNVVKASGRDWRKLTWQERLAVVLEVESSMPEEPAEEEVNKPEAPPKPGSMFDGMTQAALVDYAIQRYDMNFAGTERGARETLYAFREHLKTVSGPEDVVEIKKYLAKGTAGWVFLAEWKDTGARVAMKMIRMTQALSGIKEWYVSKLLRRAKVQNVVFTAETVCVLGRSTAPPIVDAQLKDAGPVPYYLCMIQDFMGGGSLEDLAEDGRLTPKTMFQALEDVASTLAAMHKCNVQHKDVKPENVLVEMEGETLTAAKLCDFGSAEIGDNAADRADDIRRFGVTMFSLATGESWTKKRLIHEKHDQLVARLRAAVQDSSDSTMRKLPEVLQKILKGGMHMTQVVEIIMELRQSC